jgi:hypothetical protein
VPFAEPVSRSVCVQVLDDPNVNKLYLVLEYMKKGDLVNLLMKKDRETPGNANTSGNGGGSGGGGSGAAAAGGSGPEASAKANGNAMFSSLSDLELWNISRQVPSVDRPFLPDLSPSNRVSSLTFTACDLPSGGGWGAVLALPKRRPRRHQTAKLADGRGRHRQNR